MHNSFPFTGTSVWASRVQEFTALISRLESSVKVLEKNCGQILHCRLSVLRAVVRRAAKATEATARSQRLQDRRAKAVEAEEPSA